MQKIPQYINRSQLFFIFSADECIIFIWLLLIFFLLQDSSLIAGIIDTVIFLFYLRKNRQYKRLYGEHYLSIMRRVFFPYWVIKNERFPAYHLREFVG
jgi:hypothetical protein